MRLATWNIDLTRRGPGLLLRDLLRADDTQISAAVALIVKLRPDVLLLTRFDHDPDGLALGAFAERLAEAGHSMPHLLAPTQNRGLATRRDLDGVGRLGGREDNQGYGRFTGNGAMALLSRWPVALSEDHTEFLWVDLPNARLEGVGQDVRDIQRLASSGFWVVSLVPEGGRALRLLAYDATPPLHDAGPRNRDRNHDETAFWLTWLEQDAAAASRDTMPVVVIGNPNIDQLAGAGDKSAIAALIAHPRLRDPKHGPSARFRSGRLRLSYILPENVLSVVAAGTLSPEAMPDAAELIGDAGDHWLVWLDLSAP